MWWVRYQNTIKLHLSRDVPSLQVQEAKSKSAMIKVLARDTEFNSQGWLVWMIYFRPEHWNGMETYIVLISKAKDLRRGRREDRSMGDKF